MIMKETKKLVSVAKYKGDVVFKITFPYNLDTLYQVRSLVGRLYHNEAKCWSAPIYPRTINQLIAWEFHFDKKAKNFLTKKEKTINKKVAEGLKSLPAPLFPFQEKGVYFIEKNNGRALITDDMGLGKTIQSLAWLSFHPELTPVLVVCPASVKLNWKKEIEKWLPGRKVQILYGTDTHTLNSDIVIINYDILSAWTQRLAKQRFTVMITDEAHYYKNSKAKRTKAVKRLGKKIKHVLALSGTPIQSRTIEIYNAITLVEPGLFPNYWNFVQKYCDAKLTQYGWDISGASNSKELHEILTSTIMIRRLKSEVLTELPDKIKSFTPLDLANRDKYRKAELDFIRYVYETKGDEAARRAQRGKALAMIEGLKQLSVEGKMKEAIEWINDFLTSGEKLVIFAEHKFVIDRLMKEYADIAVRLYGQDSTQHRQKSIERFQKDDSVKLFVGNTKAAGEGITLTAASNVAFLELPWTPGALTQAEDRCHRIGQKDAVNVYYLLATGTIEEEIAELLDKKTKVLKSVLDGLDVENEILLTELIQKYELKTSNNEKDKI